MIQTYLCVESKAALKAEVDRINDGQPITLLDTPGLVYVWNASSTAADDNNLVLRPDNIPSGDPGRYLFAYKWNLNATVKLTGTTDSSGNFTFAYPAAYPTLPNVQPVIMGGTNTQTFKLTASTVNGFTVNVVNRNEGVLGVLPSYSNVVGATVTVLVTA